MKIIFLCGCLEPGRDGVGDYARRLADELTTLDHHIYLLSINDKYAINGLTTSKTGSRSHIHTLRISSSISWKKRMSLIKSTIDEVVPDWISLQYVPFAFQDKGLPFFLAANLKKISTGIKWHIMFHELWVENPALKFKLLGEMQKRLIRRMLHNITPHVIHTHLPIYFKDLLRLSVNVKELPLFSNFPEDSSSLVSDMNVFRVAFFNHTNHSKKVTDFLVTLYNRVIEKDMEFEILLIGASTELLDKFAKSLKIIPCFANKVSCLGFLEESMVSKVLKTCRLGVSPMNLSELGKSGTTAAFLTQGIPIAVPVTDQRDLPFFNPALMDVLIYEPDIDKVETASRAAKLVKDHLSVSKIAQKFMNDLTFYN